MEISIIKIGNSKGLRIPKDILTQYNITDKVEMIFEKGYIILKPKLKSRRGWEKAFKEMSENQHDELILDDLLGDEDFEEWQ